MDSHDAAPLISVIVPAYNCEAYLGEAIASLTNQTISEIEVIVVDDGSTDNTYEIASEHARRDPRIRVIRQDAPSGKPASARNRGLRDARGKYVALLDADDIALPDRLATAVAALNRTGASVAFADFRRFYDGGARLPMADLERKEFVRRAAEYMDMVADRLFRCHPTFVGFMLTEMVAVNVQTLVLAREVLGGEGEWFNETLVGGEDQDLFYRLAASNTVVFINEVQTLMRDHAGSLTKRHEERCMTDSIVVRKTNLARLRRRLSPAEVRGTNTGIAHTLFDLGYVRWCEGRGEAARAAYLDSWRTQPMFCSATGYLKALVPRDVLVAFASPLKAATRYRRRRTEGRTGAT